MKYLKILILMLVLIFGAAAVSSHGVDVTADTMVVANDTNGILVKDIADTNGINISVYKFTSEDEVAHILEHSINNTNKRMLFVAYQDTANNFLKDHQELSKRIIVVDDVNNDTIKQGLQGIMNAPTGNVQQESSFGIPLVIGIVIGALLGIAGGIFIMKKKK
jgi:long-subunit acyl-CoA synthetase (AMP-forming)